MDLLDRLLGHDAWTTGRLLLICETLTDDQLDRQFDIGHKSLRATLDHIIHNMEVWSLLMAHQDARPKVDRETDCSIAGLQRRLHVAAARLSELSRRVSDTDSWDDTWIDYLDNPPRPKTFGTAIAHVITHSMHHRAQILYMLRKLGAHELPQGDVFGWESAVF